jgi:hypothetical protein
MHDVSQLPLYRKVEIPKMNLRGLFSMESTISRKEKYTNTKRSLNKKVTIIAIVGAITIGAGTTFGSTSLVGNVQDYIAGILGTKKADLSTHTNTTQGTEVTDIQTFLNNLKTTIAEQLGTHTETEKTRATTEITQYNENLQAEADAQATTDITAGKTELTNLANTEISEAKAALDQKYTEIFPAPAAEPTNP